MKIKHFQEITYLNTEYLLLDISYINIPVKDFIMKLNNLKIEDNPNIFALLKSNDDLNIQLACKIIEILPS
mgnify:FL=1